MRFAAAVRVLGFGLMAATAAAAFSLLRAQEPSHAVLQIHFLDPAGSGAVVRTDAYALADPGNSSIGDWAGRYWVKGRFIGGRFDPIIVVAYETINTPAESRQSRFAALTYDGTHFTPRQFEDVGPIDSEIHFVDVFLDLALIKMHIYEGIDPTLPLTVHEYHWDGVAFNEVAPPPPALLPAPPEALPLPPPGEMLVGDAPVYPLAITTNSSIFAASRFPSLAVPSPDLLAVEAEPKGGVYAATLAVFLSSNSPAATIRYRLDGNDPDGGSPVFDPNVPIYILPYDAAGTSQPSVTLALQATEAGKPDSAVVRETYEVVQLKSADTDGDGLIDLWEVDHGRPPDCVANCRLDDGAGGCVAPAGPDHCFDPLVPDADVDCDRDGWSDFDEMRLGSDPSCGASRPAEGADVRRVRFSGAGALPDGLPSAAGSVIDAISPRGSDLLLHATAPATDPVTDAAGVFLDVPTHGETDVILRIVDADETQVIAHRLVPFHMWSDALPPLVFSDLDFTGADDWFDQYTTNLQYDIAVADRIVDARASVMLQLLEHEIETILPELALDYTGIPIADVDKAPVGNFPTVTDGDVDFDNDGNFDRLEFSLGEPGSGLTGRQAEVLLLGLFDLAVEGVLLEAAENPDNTTYDEWVTFAEDVFRAVPAVPEFHGTTDEVLTRILDDPAGLDPFLAAYIDALPAAPVGGDVAAGTAGPTHPEKATAPTELSGMGRREPAPQGLPADLPGLIAAVKAAAHTTAAIYGRVVARDERGLYESGDLFATGTEYRAIVAALVDERAGDLAALADIAAGAEQAARAVEEARLLAGSGRSAAVQNLAAGIGVLAAALDAADGDPTSLTNLDDRMHEVVYRIDRSEGDPGTLALLEASASDFLVPDVDPPVVAASPPGPLFTGSVSVTLLSDEPAIIYYTLDGSDPVPGGPTTVSGGSEIAGISITVDTILSWSAEDVPWGNMSGVSRITYLHDADIDGVADISDNCPDDFNPGQDDFDADTLGDVCDPDDDNDLVADAADCRPMDPTLWAAPGDLPITLDLTDEETVEWSSLAGLAGPATVYDLASGALSDAQGRPPAERFDDAVCLLDDTATLAHVDAEVPTVGDGFYYLVRGENACGTGTFGLDSSVQDRLVSACP
jgi:hypothetical protein